MTSYNKKIVRTSSYIEIWEYEKPIFSSDKIAMIDENVEQLESKKEKSKRRKFDELTDDEQKNRLERMRKTRLEAKWKLLRIVDCNFDNKTSFLTLTTKKNVQDRDEFNSLLKTFIKRFNYHIFNTKKSKLKYCATLERQKRGSYHAHILLFEVPYVPHDKLLTLWRHGAVRINKVDVDSKENRGRYCAKYFEKGIGQELLESFGKKAFYSSRNLKKPEVLKFFTFEETEDIIKHNEVLYETEYSGKIFRNGELLGNRIKYKKIRLS